MITLTRDSASARRAVGQGIVAEQYHAVVQWVRSSDQTTLDACKSIGVTSCGHGAGVSTVAANLAVAAAQSCDRGVLLLELSGTRSLLASRLAMRGDLGLRRALQPDARAGECVTPSPIPNLSLLALDESAGSCGLGNDGRQVDALLDELSADFCFIVVDLPPVESALCFAVSGILNGVLLVIEASRTSADAAFRAKQRLVHANAAVLGVILNKHTRDFPSWLDARS
jgi:Mrp family chromosome partitioning ATPase